MVTRCPELDRLVDHTRPGDTIVILQLNRHGRSMTPLLDLIEDLKRRDIALVSLNEQIGTTSANGRLILRLLAAALATFEPDLLAARTNTGLEAARRQGRVGGRPRTRSPTGAAEATRMYREGQTVTHSAALNSPAR